MPFAKVRRWEEGGNSSLVDVKIQGELTALYPGLRVSCARLDGLIISGRDEGLEVFKSQVFERIRESVRSLDEVKDLPIIRAYRDFFWRVGLDPTKVRPAGEALARRIIGGKGIPAVNTFVDSYNLASAETLVPMAAFDLSTVGEDLLMRRARGGERFLGIGMDSPSVMRGIEVVIEDRRDGKLVAVYPYRDADAGKVREKSRNVLIVACGVPGVDMPTLERARDLAVGYVLKYCGPTRSPSV
jgi:DNA/RNA-binding domain of Phe-tRNA-synthetase-like protein